jgi:hypothetical protein
MRRYRSAGATSAIILLATLTGCASGSIGSSVASVGPSEATVSSTPSSAASALSDSAACAAAKGAVREKLPPNELAAVIRGIARRTTDPALARDLRHEADQFAHDDPEIAGSVICLQIEMASQSSAPST